MKKWTVEIKGDEEVAVKYITAMLEAFKLAVKVDQPLDHVYLSDKGSSLTCTKEKS
jgi:hypothetical protein